VVLALLRLAFEEDLGSGDISSEATVPEACAATALVVARQPLVAAGVPLLDSVFSVMAERGRAEEEASTLSLLEQAADGARLQAGELLCRIDGSARALLAVERPLLNLLGHLCGVASATSAVVAGCSIPEKQPPGRGRWRSTRCAAAVDTTIAWGCTTRC
jgi:nicotinate-nucleotide pyrophosphorylase (carboxylating)